MNYSHGYPVRLIGGRLVLDFLNTADWSRDGTITHEKIDTLEDAKVWMHARGLPELDLPASAAELRDFRQSLRTLFLDWADGDEGLDRVNETLQGIDGDVLARTENGAITSSNSLSLRQMIALSAFSALADPREAARIKLCPADNCGRLFLDETKNARRKWCSMETCGNRAKARRSYERSKEGSA